MRLNGGRGSGSVGRRNTRGRTTPRIGSLPLLLPLPLLLVLGVVGCSHGPPPDFAPDPGLVGRIRDLLVTTSPSQACPGEQIQASYEAVLDDGSTLLFERRYDKKHPPRLHVVFLRRSSLEATPLEGGDWSTSRDPLLSAMHGFRLNVFLREKPSVNKSVVVQPEYGCMPHAFAFSGAAGSEGQAGGDGPDITVRVGILRSPFVQRLLVASIEVGEAPPFFVFADAARVPPADWLIVESHGGRGGRGTDGQPGQAGGQGAAGCPGGAGGPGGQGGSGGPGAAGGRGGRITVMAPTEEPFLAGLVDGRSIGGEGGPGGRGGKGGVGGKGGAGQAPQGMAPGRRCDAGANGSAGANGVAGPGGAVGSPGPRAQTLTLPQRDVFAPVAQLRPELADLIDYASSPRKRDR